MSAVPWTKPERAGDVIVIGLLEHRLPHLTGQEVATGRKLWSRPMSPSSVVRGIAMSFRVRDGIVEFLEGKAKLRTMKATVTSVRAATGGVIARTSAGEFDSYPSACDHDEQSTCVEFDGRMFQLGKDRRTLRTVPTPPSADLAWMQQIGPYGLVRFREPGDAVGLASVDGTKVHWRASESEIFGPGFSTNGGRRPGLGRSWRHLPWCSCRALYKIGCELSTGTDRWWIRGPWMPCT